MKKLFAILVAMLFCTTLFATNPSYYYRGNQNDWGATALTGSTDGFYAYFAAKGYTNNGNKNNIFTISESTSTWEHKRDKLDPGFNSTNITNMNKDNDWGVGDNNCAIYNSADFYILVYYPHTLLNSTDDPKICASTVLPNDEEEEDPTPVDSTTVYFVDMLDWGAANAFVWPATGSAYKGWPGEAMKKTAEKAQGKDVYAYTFPSSFVNIIFNHESTQTVDLEWSKANPYFCPETANSEEKITGKWYVSASEIPTPYVVIPETMKLVPGSSWNVDGAKFAVYTWGGECPAAWSAFFEGTGDTLHAEIDSKADSLVLVRFNSATAKPTWDNEETNIWGKIDKILIDHTSLVYTVTSYTTGTWKSVANYYVTGDSALVVDGGLTEDKEWAEDAFPSFKDTLVLKNLKANQEYKLKIVAGSDWKGYSDLTSLSSGLSVDEDNNIIFKLTAKGDVTIVYTGEEFKVLGSFVDPEFDPATQEHLKLVPYRWKNDNAKIAVFTWGKKIEGKWSAFFTGEGDTLQTVIRQAADSMVLVRFNSATAKPTWDNEGENVWNKIDKILIDHKGLVYTIKNWDEGTWESYAPPVPVEKTVKFVPSEEWASNNAKFAAWTWGAEQEGTFSVFFAPISEGNDTLSATIKTSADSIEFVRFSPKASAPTWEQKADAEVLVWNKLKDTIDWKGLTASIEGWNTLSWKPVSIPCTYGLLINGVYKAGKKNVSASELEYKLLRVDLNEGDQLKVHDDCNGVNSVYDYESGSYDKFTKTSEMYIVNADGIYDFYIKVDSKKIYISKDGFSTTAVPNECEAVLMQAFFNESYKDDAPGVRPDADYKLGLGNTRWSTLTAQAAAISKYFDYVWLPPSANGDGMGYHPKNYGNQSSTWGSAAELAELISTLHAGGAKVVADIVINHCASTSGWIGFPEFDFGKYGKFQPKGSWICANDEVNTDPNSDSQGQATGPNDDGDNWNGARDWAHSNVEVQDMFKAYLQWMREEVGYDGFRYDKGDGFNNWHHDNYNKTAGPEIAFMECYSNTDDIQWRIGQANGNLMALDFDTKWHVFNNFQSWNYTGGYNGNRGNGLLGRLDTKHAVLFIDSHDWFLRDDNENEFGGRGNSLTEPLKARLLAANAYLLSMPGVPCVFYPHWKKYQTEIEALIKARKWAGVHSESWVSDEQIENDGNGYQITVEGKHGYLILCLGTKAHQNFTEAGYKIMAENYAENDQSSGKDGSFQVWVNRCKPILANGYYLVGDKYDWTPVAEHLLVESSTAGEYVLQGIVLEADDSLKVVRVEKDEIIQWYPGGNNYVVDVTHEGTKTVYFRPKASDPIYIEPNNHATFIEETNEMPQIKAEKFFENGKMYIRLGDKVYDVIGQTIK